MHSPMKGLSRIHSSRTIGQPLASTIDISASNEFIWSSSFFGKTFQWLCTCCAERWMDGFLPRPFVSIKISQCVGRTDMKLASHRNSIYSAQRHVLSITCGNFESRNSLLETRKFCLIISSITGLRLQRWVLENTQLGFHNFPRAGIEINRDWRKERASNLMITWESGKWWIETWLRIIFLILATSIFSENLKARIWVFLEEFPIDV